MLAIIPIHVYDFNNRGKEVIMNCLKSLKIPEAELKRLRFSEVRVAANPNLPGGIEVL